MNPATSPLKSRRRTLQGVLRERLPQIEATLRAGYRMQTIVEQLAQEGFHTTLGAFRDGLYRARCVFQAIVDELWLWFPS